MEPLSNAHAQLFPYICVSKPYFALEDVRTIAPGCLAARLPVQQPLCLEVGPITAGEVGRHLAILGLCAASTINPRRQRHYYLAHEGRLEANMHATGQLGDTWLRARARASIDGPRKAHAEAELFTDDGDVLYTVAVSYYVITEAVFAKLFEANRRECTPPAYNPYARYIPLTVVKRSPDSMVCAMDAVQPQHCHGHFSGYPALPVAVAIGKMIEAASWLYRDRLNRADFVCKVAALSIKAENLAFAGESITIMVTHEGPLEIGERFRCSATSNAGKSVGEMLVDLVAS